MDKACKLHTVAHNAAQHVSRIAVDLTEQEQDMLLSIYELIVVFPIIKDNEAEKKESTS